MDGNRFLFGVNFIHLGLQLRYLFGQFIILSFASVAKSSFAILPPSIRNCTVLLVKVQARLRGARRLVVIGDQLVLVLFARGRDAHLLRY